MTGERVVVLVDDEPYIRETISFILELEGYQVRAAVNGREGLELIREVKPRAVLLDAMMPEMDGFEVCRRLRADPEVAGTTVFMLTAMGQKLDQETAHAAGVDHFLTKPFEDEEVLRLLDEAFGTG